MPVCIRTIIKYPEKPPAPEPDPDALPVALRTSRWSAKEDAILKKHYKQLGPKKLMSMLPGRSEKALWERAARLDLRDSHKGRRTAI